MIRKIIEINEEKCNGCGLCADACHEGAIGMVNGKAHLLRDDYCDGLGDCLPACPAGAISFTEREAASYNAEAVKKHQTAACHAEAETEHPVCLSVESELRQWPVQIKLVPVSAPYFEGAALLIAADCTAFAYANFHRDFMQGKITLVGCPKLDAVDYSEKLTEILIQNHIKSVTVARMEVPCCGGIELAVKTALRNSKQIIPCQVVTFSTEGKILV